MKIIHSFPERLVERQEKCEGLFSGLLTFNRENEPSSPGNDIEKLVLVLGVSPRILRRVDLPRFVAAYLVADSSLKRKSARTE